MKKVSVIIPAYNVEKYIRETLISVFNQAWNNIEVIVVNDGSTDTTGEILQDFRDRVLVLSQDNQGVCGATNTALKVSTGDYICLQDADDLMAKDKIEHQVEFLEKNPDYGLVFTNGVHINEQGDVIKQSFYEKEPPQGCIFKDLFCRNTVAGPTMMMTREAYNRTGPLDTRCVFQDYQLALRIAYYYKVGYLDERLYMYRRHGTNISSKLLNSVFADLFTLESIIDLFGDVKDIVGEKTFCNRMSELYYRAARFESTYGNNWRMAKTYYKQSLNHKKSFKAMGFYLFSHIVA